MSNPRPLRPARLAMPVALVAAALLAGCGDSGKVDEELRATLIQPVARVEIQAVTITPGTRTGEQIYKSICAACHDAGAVGAPKTGDAAAWGPRLALGHDGLTASAIALMCAGEVPQQPPMKRAPASVSLRANKHPRPNRPVL